MRDFVGRERELQLLRQLSEKRSANLVVLTGRRRIGKSRLIEEFAERSKDYRHAFFSALPPQPGIDMAAQRREFAAQLQRGLSLPPVKSDDWGDLFEHLARATAHGKWIILLDEVSWMGHRDSEFLPKLKVAWDTRFQQNPALVMVLCGSVSSWLDRNVLSSTGFVGRVSLHIRLDELSLRECDSFWGAWRRRVTFADKLKVLAVTGGVPRYLEEIIPKEPADDNIRRLCFQPEGLLFREFDQIFTDLFCRRGPAYQAIVSSLAAGPGDTKSICRTTGIQKGGIISSYLADLVMAGFIEETADWSLRTPVAGKLRTYRLKDNYLRFFLKYVHPNRDRIVRGRFQQLPLSAMPGWESIMGLQFENLVLHNRAFIWERSGLAPAEITREGPYLQRATRGRQGCQIDYLIQTRHGPIYLCEIKFTKGTIDSAIEAEVQEKVRRLRVPRHSSVLPVLIHAGEVSESVRYGDCFAKIIDFAEAVDGCLSSRLDGAVAEIPRRTNGA